MMRRALSFVLRRRGAATDPVQTRQLYNQHCFVFQLFPFLFPHNFFVDVKKSDDDLIKPPTKNKETDNVLCNKPNKRRAPVTRTSGVGAMMMSQRHQRGLHHVGGGSFGSTSSSVQTNVAFFCALQVRGGACFSLSLFDRSS